MKILSTPTSNPSILTDQTDQAAHLTTLNYHFKIIPKIKIHLTRIIVLLQYQIGMNKKNRKE